MTVFNKSIFYACDKTEKYNAPAIPAFMKNIHFMSGKFRIWLHSFTRVVCKWSFAIYAWIVFLLTLCIGGSLIVVLHRPIPGRIIARFALRLLFRLVRIPLTVTGIERLPKDPHILLVNHTGFLDTLVLIALLPAFPGYAFVAKQQYRSQGLLWPLLHALGTLVLNGARTRKATGNMEAWVASLARGERLIIFPEGGIASYPGIKPFHSGAFIAAANAHVPLVIAGLRGTRESLPLHTWLPRRTAISLAIGPIIIYEKGDDVALSGIIRKAHAAMASLCEEEEIFR